MRNVKSYIRGLSVNDKAIVYGVSSGREVSRSSKKINNPSDKGKFLGKSGIVVFDKINKKSKFYNLLGVEKEIYDVLIIDDRDATSNLVLSGVDKIGRLDKPGGGVLTSVLKEENDRLLRVIIKQREELNKTKNRLNVITASKFYLLFLKYEKYKAFVYKIIKFIRNVKS
jgi:hypothetical protein